MGAIVPFLGGAAATGAACAVAFLCASRRRARDEGEAAESVRRRERLAYAGRLAGGLIHEIKNPLNTLSLNLQLLAEDWERAQTPQERRALKRIKLLQSETNRLNAVLDDFLSFVRGHDLQLAECDVNRLVDDVLTFVQPELASGGIEVRRSAEPLPPCRLDANLLKQALLNLVLNAEQAVANSAVKEIIVRTEAGDDSVRIDLIDTGKGIPAGDEDKVFEAFYSGRKGGTGLGLPLTRRIVEEHGGSIAVHSDRGRGTCFTILLPTRPAEDEADAPAEGSDR